jgi:endonuclease YncB( thermonuclease family)|tara:strand:- start:229 stop:684 length:456 start_codon:yes stop_codon:yes gene_type:complete
LILFSPQVFADLSGVISRVIDADTIIFKSDQGINYKVRLLGIDAPEINQVYGKEANRYLSNKVLGKKLTVLGKNKDRYQRLLGKLILDGNDINLDLVKNGMAWHYKFYKKSQEKKDQLLYSNAEKYAKVNKLGLWGEEMPVPPWKWRKKNK